MNPEERTAQIPYFAHEGMMARQERTIRRLTVALIVTIVLIFASNVVWLIYMSGYDVEAYDYSQDGEGVNIIGNKNGVDYDVSKVGSDETDTEKENN